MDSRQQLEYLKTIGIKLWVPRDSEQDDSQSTPVAKTETPVPEIALTAPPGDVLGMDWQLLRETVLACQACRLHEGRTQAVFGVGNQRANLMVVGEAPGADEDIQGEPFVGRAGKLLDEMLFAIGYPRESVYIANIVKCRPPENRNPQHDEAIQCADYLKRQIQLISPKAILAVGKVAAQNLLQDDTPIGKMRGNQYHYAELNIPVIVTYHPAYLLRSPKEKAKVWQDLKLVRELLNA